MRTWKNAVETAQEALQRTDELQTDHVCGYCRWWSWPGETCFYGAASRYADYVRAFDPACAHYATARGCITCRHYLDGGQCASSLEQECRDGGFEAWEGRE